MTIRDFDRGRLTGATEILRLAVDAMEPKLRGSVAIISQERLEAIVRRYGERVAAGYMPPLDEHTADAPAAKPGALPVKLADQDGGRVRLLVELDRLHDGPGADHQIVFLRLRRSFVEVARTRGFVVKNMELLAESAARSCSAEGGTVENHRGSAGVFESQKDCNGPANGK